MRIAILGAGHVGSTLGRLWRAAGHDVTFAARHDAQPRALAAELGAHAATFGDAVRSADVVLVAIPGPAVADVLGSVGPLDGRVMIHAANSFGQRQVTLRSLADAFPARWVRAFNSLSASVMADDNHHQPLWVMFMSGDEKAKKIAAPLIRDAGFDPFDLGDIDDSQLQDPDSPLWTNVLTHDEATALVSRIRSGDTAADPQVERRTRERELAGPFAKVRDQAPDDPAFFLEHLTRSVFEAGISWRVVEGKWDGIKAAFHDFDPARVAAMPPSEITAVESDPRVIRNKAKIQATVENAREVLAILDRYGSIRGYLASFPDVDAATTDLRHRFKFLGDTGIWRLLSSESGDIDQGHR